jgi:hypothetical protein
MGWSIGILPSLSAIDASSTLIATLSIDIQACPPGQMI